MVIWNQFDPAKSLPDIIEKVGMFEDTQTSNHFLVMCKFARLNEPFIPRMAHIYCYVDGSPYSLLVDGLSGKVEVSYWTEINAPEAAIIASDEDVKVSIKQLNNTLLNNKERKRLILWKKFKESL